jgi:hypothetical protein
LKPRWFDKSMNIFENNRRAGFEPKAVSALQRMSVRLDQPAVAMRIEGTR